MKKIEELGIEEWQLQAIQEGIDAVDRGEVMDCEDVKKLLHAKRKMLNNKNKH